MSARRALGAGHIFVSARLADSGRFVLVGLLGLGVNQAALLLLVEGTHLNYLLGAVLASQASTAFNFAGVELWAFGGRKREGGLLARFLAFDALNASSLILRLPIMFLLTSGLHLHYLASNLIAIGFLTAVRFLVSDGIIWPRRLAGAGRAQ